jgi:hypothetical protein
MFFRRRKAWSCHGKGQCGSLTECPLFTLADILLPTHCEHERSAPTSTPGIRELNIHSSVPHSRVYP